MATTDAVLRGTVHGKTIQLEQASGSPDGQQVRVTVQPVEKTKRLPPGEGLRRSFGAWADDAEELDPSGP